MRSFNNGVPEELRSRTIGNDIILQCYEDGIGWIDVATIGTELHQPMPYDPAALSDRIVSAYNRAN